MCLWLLTACLGLLPSNPSPTVVVVGAPQPILLPLASTAATTTTTTVRPAGNTMGMPTNVTGGGANPAGGGGNTIPGAQPGGTPPSGAPPIGVPPIGVPPSGVPPSGVPPSGVPPSGVPPSGVPPSGLPPSGGNPAGNGGLPPNMAVMPTNQPRAPGIPPIDPRLGTTPPPPPYEQQYQPPPLMGYSGQNPNFDTAVKFPRNKRSLLLQNLVEEYGRHSRQKRQSCSCVPFGMCPTQNNNGGAGLIDFRIVNPGNSQVQCGAGQVYCCLGAIGPGAGVQCGVRQAVPVVATTSVSVGQAPFGQYPWQALILTKQNDYIGGGVLIDQYNVLTVTHRLQPYIVAGTAPNVKVRLGEWDAAGSYEPIPYQEYTVLRTFSHPSYNAGTLQYDITVVRLSTPVPFGSTATINRACLPTAATASFVGQRCWVSGWGKNEFGVQGQYQQILKQVDVPIVDSNACEAQLRTARLGPSYNLDRTSFICAGGEINKDSCTGDGGSGLVCQVNGQWTLIGLVAWGLGCANPNVPGVYVNIAALLPWVQQQVVTI